MEKSASRITDNALKMTARPPRIHATGNPVKTRRMKLRNIPIARISLAGMLITNEQKVPYSR